MKNRFGFFPKTTAVQNYCFLLETEYMLSSDKFQEINANSDSFYKTAGSILHYQNCQVASPKTWSEILKTSRA